LQSERSCSHAEIVLKNTVDFLKTFPQAKTTFCPENTVPESLESSGIILDKILDVLKRWDTLAWPDIL
jgi:hypothetical protein